MSAPSFVLNLIGKLQASRQLHRSLGKLLQRPDDHLLDDIGLTRDLAERLIAAPLADAYRFGGMALSPTPMLRATAV